MQPTSLFSMRRLALLSVAGLLAACGDSGAPGYAPTSANIVGPPIPATTLDTAQLKVCKFGSAGTFTVTIDGNASQLSLNDGECAIAGNIPPLAEGPHSFTVSENADPATVFDSIEVFRTVLKTTVVYQTSAFTPSFSTARRASLAASAGSCSGVTATGTRRRSPSAHRPTSQRL